MEHITLNLQDLQVIDIQFRNFQEVIKLIVCTHNVSRNCQQMSDDGGHLINENTLVRIYNQLDACLDIIKDKRRRCKCSIVELLEMQDLNGFDAYITMQAYRNSIIHHGGTLSEQLFDRENNPRLCDHNYYVQGSLSKYYSNYMSFCNSIDDPRAKTLQPGNKLMLAMNEPRFLSTMIDDISIFAEELNMTIQKKFSAYSDLSEYANT